MVFLALRDSSSSPSGQGISDRVDDLINADQY